MKEFDTWEAMQMAFKHYKKDSITVGELNLWSDKYQEEHTDTYLHICRNDIHHEHDCGRIWWEIRDQGPDIIHKQESIKCAVCGGTYYKYPNIKKFEKINKLTRMWYEFEADNASQYGI